MELTLTKSKTFKLEPFGKFTISMAKKPKNLPHIIDYRELSMYHENSMPFTAEQEKEFVKYLRKHKTDIVTDGSYFGFYTRTNSGLTLVRHDKLIKYREDEGFRSLVDER